VEVLEGDRPLIGFHHEMFREVTNLPRSVHYLVSTPKIDHS
jgi:hypothetical protein